MNVERVLGSFIFFISFFLTRLERLGTAAGAAVQTAAGVPEDLPVCLAAVCMIGVNYRRVSVCLWGGRRQQIGNKRGHPLLFVLYH